MRMAALFGITSHVPNRAGEGDGENGCVRMDGVQGWNTLQSYLMDLKWRMTF